MTGSIKSIKDACSQYIKDNRITSRSMLLRNGKCDFNAIYAYVEKNAPTNYTNIKTPRASVRRCIQQMLPGYTCYTPGKAQGAAARSKTQQTPDQQHPLPAGASSCNLQGMRPIVFKHEIREKMNNIDRDKHNMMYEFTESTSAKTLVFPSKKRIAEDILRVLYSSPAILVSFCAPMQYGKTSVLVHLAYLALGASDEEIVDIGLEPSPRVSKIFVLTGLNDKDWLRQTKQRFDCCFGEHNNITVIHRGGLKKSIAMLAKVRDAIIFIDECHYGSGKKQTIKQVLEKASLLSKENLCSRNVRIVQISATPDSTLMGPQGWIDQTLHKTIVADWNVDGYISPLTILEDGRCYAPMDLRKTENVYKVLEPFTNAAGGIIKLGVIIIRVPPKMSDREKILENFRHAKQEKYKGVVLFEHNCETDTHDDMEKYLVEGPPQGKIVICFVKGFYRAAKTFPRHDHLLAVHEPWRTSTASTATATQSLLGRMCGYHGNRKVLVYTYESSVKEYIELVEKEFDLSRLENYNSSTVRIKDGETRKCRQAFSSDICLGGGVSSKRARKRRTITYLIYPSAQAVKADFGCRLPKPRAPKTLRKNGHNPPVESVLKRQWGLSRKIHRRTVAAIDKNDMDVWVVYKRTDTPCELWNRVVQSSPPHWSKHDTYVPVRE